MNPSIEPQSPIQTRLVALNAALCLTHEQVADYLGVSPHTLRKWISGERAPGGLLVRTLDILDLVQTLAPALHDAMVQDVTRAPAAPAKRIYRRKVIPKTDPEICKNFPHARVQANLVEKDFPEKTNSDFPKPANETIEPVSSAEMQRKPDPDDVMVWPDGTWCYRTELGSMTHMSDDYYVLFADTPEWAAFPTD